VKNYIVLFLTISFILGYLSFGFIAFSTTSFLEILSNPLHLTLLIIGFLSPLAASLICHSLHRDKLGGLDSLKAKLKPNNQKGSLIMLFILLAIHYGLAYVLRIIDSYGDLIDLFKYFPLMLILLGSQEIGWRSLVQPYFEEEKGYAKSIIITGLFWALWFFPLTLIRGFIIPANFFTQFAAYLVGLSFLLTSLYKSSGSLIYPILLSTLIFALVPVIIFKLSNMFIGLAILEGVISLFFKGEVAYKNT